MIEKKTLIYDIETATSDGKPNPSLDKLKFFGCYSYITNKYYFLTDIEKIKDIIKKHDYLIGFNNIQYDNHVLFKNGLNELMQSNNYEDYTFKYKINIDLYNIFKKRAGGMKIKKGMLGNLLMSYSLDYISKTIGIVDDDTGKIKNFDYSIFNKESFTKSELNLIIKYLKRDVEVTKKMYEWLENYFSGFKHFLNEEDIKKKVYLTAATSVFSYKAICKELGIKEEYSRDIIAEKYGGGYVAYPAGESFEGKIICNDFNSLYPHVFAQCNLYSIENDKEKAWHGDGFFKVEGYYNKEKMGHIEELIMRLYKLRKVYKKNKDPREYSIKIIINTMYGLAGNPVFKNLYNRQTAGDCTRLARQWVKLARKYFRDKGYKIIYTDTDSWYFIDVFNNEEKAIETKNEVIDLIKKHVPFPQDTFDAGIDYRITNMWFFKGANSGEDKESDKEMDEDDFLNKPKGFMKKNYIFLTTDGKVVVKNLGVQKKSTSLLTRKIFWDYLVPKIKEEKRVKFKKEYFENLMNDLLNEDLFLASKRYKVFDAKSYKSPNQLQAQIARKYGNGIHFLIPNYKYGIGKGKKYCTVDEFKEKKLSINDIDLTGIWRELQYFIIDYNEKNNKIKQKSKNLFSF